MKFRRSKQSGGDEIVNRRYYEVAGSFRMVRHVSLIFLTVFLFCMYFMYSSSLSVDHFKYLLRNLEFSPSTMFSLGDSIYIDSDSTSKCVGYKGGLAVLSGDKISLYDMTSSTTLSEYHGYRDADMVVSDKYMLVYDRKSSEYSVYSAFSRLGSFKTERAVRLAALADDGTHLIVCDDSEYYSSVFVYNSNFKIINRIDKYKYVTAADITKDGKMIAVASSYVGESGSFVSEVMLLGAGKREASEIITVDGMLIYDIVFFSNGSFVLIGDSAMRFYTAKGEYNDSVSYAHGFPDYYEINEDHIIFAYDKDPVKRKTALVAYDRRGEQVSYTELDGCFKDMVSTTHEVYVLLDSSVARVSVMSGKVGYDDLPVNKDKIACGSLVRGANEDVYLYTGTLAKKVSK
jgi:hypothetical protein